jgi:hypothetical protein
MKKYLLMSTILWSITILLNGQTEKPYFKCNILVGGSFSFGYNKDFRFIPGTPPTPDQTATTRTFNYGTDINAAYFFVNHFAAGLKTEVQLSTYKTIYRDNFTFSVKGSENIFSIGPVLRYYTNPGFYLELYYGIYNWKQKWDVQTEKYKYSLWSTSIGYSYFFVSNVAVEPQVKYSTLHYKWTGLPDKETLNKIEFLIGLQIYLKL